MFVVFEGLDATGKSTQIGYVADWLRRMHGMTVVTTYEPGGTPVGDQIRQIVRENEHLHPRTQVLLYNAARAELVETVINPAILRGDIVLCDRYYFSTYAYQVATGEAGYVAGPTTYAIGQCQPDMVFLLDAAPQALVSRRAAGNWQDKMPFLGRRQVRNLYLEMARSNPVWTVIDATADPLDITQQIVGEIMHLANLAEVDFA